MFIFLLDIFSDETEYTEDELFTKRQNARHVCVALKRYYEAHLLVEAEILRRNTAAFSTFESNLKGQVDTNVPPYKSTRYSYDVIMEKVETLLELMPIRINWKPVDELLKLSGVKLLIQLIAVSYDWNFTGKAEAVRSALDVLVVCSVTPKFQNVLCENVPVGEDNQNTVGIRIILAAAEGEIVADPDCQRSALNVIINCVCGPLSRIGGSIARLCGGSAKKRSFRSGEDLLTKMWNCVRSNNGIMILLNLMMVKTPITDADSIRALSCKALCGLARSETVRQIISKLPLFTNGQIQGLMKEPILQDKRTEHIKFCKYCIELIERVTGAPVATNLETSIANINKAEVVAQTRIEFNEKELLQLIYHHLMKKGLSKTAQLLHTEAELPSFSSSRNAISLWPITPLSHNRVSRPISTAPFPSSLSNATAISCLTPTSTSALTPVHTNNMSSPSSLQNVNSQSPSVSIRIHRPNPNKSSAKSLSVRKLQSTHPSSPVIKRLNEISSQTQNVSSISLDSIVTEYLRKQHSLCKNPVITCPPFDLFTPHRCPEPMLRDSAPINMTTRLQRRSIFPRFGGLNGSKMDRKFIYSRFRPIRSFRDPESTSSFSSCAFSYVDQFLFLGTLTGDLAAFNLHSGTLEATYTCHESEITHIEPSRDGKLILTSSLWRQPLSSLWTFTDVFELKHSFRDDYYVEFGKQSQDRVLGTKDFTAHLYDLPTGQMIHTYQDENLSNRYVKNRATFHPTDDLILNDGVLWDTRSATPVHKFDKFNQHINGVFHPNGQEILSNSEIWDIKTFHLLKTVPALDQCRIKFNNIGDVIYGAVFEEENSEEDDQSKSPFCSSFRTFDAYDYTNIATIDVKRNIYDLAVDPGDCYIALVENQSNREVFANESVARLFEIGRSKEDDDEEDDEDDDEDENDVADEDTDEDENLDNTEDFDLENGDESADDESDGDHSNDSDSGDSDGLDDAMLMLSDHSSDRSSDDEIVYQLND
ncbi:unnamed protein product [Medioppia subpectinata]|uniref:DDB1- and CUL4-associated factor 1 n=2 Tax=Medioppia subpectinata TaxID=1979941 RepID=A0A7R9KZV6_9ACAR|nr:unnamed protein product [Medioppia subpectinata]CAG2112664.1 unnamed protein product [Medioppia subpectinata]